MGAGPAGQQLLSPHDFSKLAWEIKENNNTLMMRVRRHKKQ